MMAFDFMSILSFILFSTIFVLVYPIAENPCDDKISNIQFQILSGPLTGRSEIEYRKLKISNQNNAPIEILKIRVSSSPSFKNGAASSSRIGTGPNHCGIEI
jgi:hypothetical protein